MPQDDAGMESMPMALLLGMALAVSSVAIGVVCIDRAQQAGERQRALESFEFFAERAQLLSAGGVGGAQIVSLELGDCSIVVAGRVVQLTSGSSPLRSEILPMELVIEGGELRSGNYSIETVRTDDGHYILKVEAI